jgi:hypothetical protein
MKAQHWLFVISVCLFVSGIGFVIAAERTARSVPSAEKPATAALVPPVATVKQVMAGMVQPSATVVWDSVATIVSVTGIEDKRPTTDDEWALVSANAAMLVEAANLLIDRTRAVDAGEWVTMAQAMAASGRKALDAANAKSADGILAVGDEINQTCDACHERYSRN